MEEGRGLSDLQLTSMLRGLVTSGPASDCILVVQPKINEIVVQAYPSSNYVVVFTTEIKKQITKALLEWLPNLSKITFDPHR